jgi:hypothetical protein
VCDGQLSEGVDIGFRAVDVRGCQDVLEPVCLCHLAVLPADAAKNEGHCILQAGHHGAERHVGLHNLRFGQLEAEALTDMRCLICFGQSSAIGEVYEWGLVSF